MASFVRFEKEHYLITGLLYVSVYLDPLDFSDITEERLVAIVSESIAGENRQKPVKLNKLKGKLQTYTCRTWDDVITILNSFSKFIDSHHTDISRENEWNLHKNTIQALERTIV